MSNSHMRSFVMQILSPLKSLPRSALAAFAGTVMAATASLAGPMPKEAGVWFDDTGKGAVKIEPCGGKLCGRIVWLKDLVNDKGEPLIDRHNPDASMKSRPICGLQILGQLDALPEGGFDNGWIYDPKEGKSYSLALALSGPDELSVTGYKGVKFLSKTFTWKRAKTDLPSCAAAPIEAKAPSAKAAGGAVVAPAAAAGAAAGTAAKATVKSPARAEAAPAAVPAAKSSKAGAAEALPWSGGATAKPAAKTSPQGASNLGAPKVGASKTAPPNAPAAKATVTKSSVAKPSAAKPITVKPAVIKAKPAIVEPVKPVY